MVLYITGSDLADSVNKIAFDCEVRKYMKVSIQTGSYLLL